MVSYMANMIQTVWNGFVVLGVNEGLTGLGENTPQFMKYRQTLFHRSITLRLYHD